MVQGRLGIGGCGEFITVPLGFTFFLTLFPCSSIGPSCGLQSFRINLLQCGLSKGSSPSVKSASSGLESSTCCSVDICSDVVFSVGCREIPAPPWSLPKLTQAAEEYLLQLLEYPFLLHWSWRLHDCFSHFFSSFLTFLHNIFPFLSHIFPEVWPASLMGWAVSCGGSVGVSRNWLCPAWGSPWPSRRHHHCSHLHLGT